MITVKLTKLNMKWILLIMLLLSKVVYAASEAEMPKQMTWAFDGVTGKFDYESIQRGFKVYKEVCSACHSVKLLAFRNLEQIGFTQDQVKSLAAEYDIQDGPNDNGDMFKRPGRLSDQIPGPFANEKAARASNNGALPPDLSLIIKARQGGANYVYSLLTGFQNPPEGFKLGENMYYNPYFVGGQIAMTPPLVSEGQVTFDDGTKATVDQMAHDVVNFLQWAAEPEMQDRKSLGLRVMIFVGILIVLSWLANKAIWSDLKRKRDENIK
jgi:ubiquinol-cytochrome c reductase cytochrome c1 subunit